MSEAQETRSRLPWPRIVAGLAVLAVFFVTVLVLWRTGMPDRLRDGEAIEQAVKQFGPLGPTLIVGFMTVAIVMSTIPSPSIALASGAVYGHYWGALTGNLEPMEQWNQFERRLIQERTRAGLAVARARGRKGGRKPISPDDPRVMTAKRMHKDHGMNIDQICETPKISRPTFYRYLALPDCGSP